MRELSPGLAFYWPITTEYESVCIVERSTQLCGQVIGNRLISANVVWKVTDAKAALVKYRDLAVRFDNAAQESLIRNKGDCFAVHDELASEFDGVVQIISCGLVNDGQVIPIKLVQDWGHFETKGTA